MPEQQALVEASASLNEIRQGRAYKGRFRALLIRAGWGSSGYYSETVLKRDGPRVWPAGTQMYLDHQTETESAERPEGSVKDWAAEIVTTPKWDPELRGLVAEVQIFPQWRDLLNEEFAPKVGLSIRATGRAEYGEAEGREGPIITSLDDGISVDWVTRAGAGGRVLQLIESARAQQGGLLREAVNTRVRPKTPVETDEELATQSRTAAEGVREWATALVEAAEARLQEANTATPGDDDDQDDDDQDSEEPDDQQDDDQDDEDEQLKKPPKRMAEARNVGHWLESRLHRIFTEMADDMFGEGRLTRDERLALSTAIGEGLTAFNRVVAEQIPHLYERDIFDDPAPLPAEVSETAAQNVPAPPVNTLKEVAPVNGSTAQGTPNGGPIDLSEAELRTALAETRQKLAEAELEIAKLGDQSRELAETKAKLAEADRTNLRLIANNEARDKAIETLAESTLPEAAHERVVAAVTGDNVPLNDEGALDEAALVRNIKAAIEAERKYLAKFAEEAGLGTVRGLGSSGEGPQINVESELGEVFASIGMSESAARVAAQGRG